MEIGPIVSIIGISVGVINGGIVFILAGILKRLERLENFIMFGDLDVKERRAHAR